MDNAAEIKTRLLSQLESVCTHLLPAGKVVGHEYRIGGIDGEPGKSMAVQLAGQNRGVWKDFAYQDDPKQQGDVWALWMGARRCNFATAYDEACRYLGITRIESPAPKPLPPKPDMSALGTMTGSPVLQYWQERGIGAETLKLYKVRAHARSSEFNQHFTGFYFETPEGQPVMLKSTGILKKPDGTKDIWSTKPYFTLWGWWLVKPDTREIIITEGECYSGDTEILTPEGWTRFDVLADEQKVLQVNSDGNGEFVSPLCHIRKEYSGIMECWSTNQVDFCVTPGHKMIVLTKDGYEKEVAASEVRYQQTIKKCVKVDGPGIPLSDDQIRFAVALSADAKIDERKQTGYHKGKERRYCHFGLKRQRKVERLHAILKSIGIQYLFTANPKNRIGYNYFSFSIPDWVPGRFFPTEWLSLATLRQRKLILEELIHWDGNSVPNRNQTEYSSKYIDNATWIQTLAMTSGISATIIDRRNQFGKWFKVSLLHGKQTASIDPKHNRKEQFTGRVYCVQVPSGRLLVRRNRKIAVCGNCDAMSLHQLKPGMPVLSLPSGASNMDWIENDWLTLQRFERIWIGPDMDAAGEAAAKTMAKRLGLARCLRLHVLAPFKDWNEALCNAEPEALNWETIKAVATSYDPKTLVSPSSLRNEFDAFSMRKKNERENNHFIWPSLPFQFRDGEMTLISGVPGDGKSAFAYQAHLHEMSIGRRVLVASFEIPPEEMLYELATMHYRHAPDESERADFIGWATGKLWFYRPPEIIQLASLLEDCKYAVSRFGVSRIIVDSLHFLADKEDYQAQDEVAKSLYNLKQHTGIHVALIAHSTTKKDEKIVAGQGDVEGSGGICKPINNGITIWRNRAKAEAIEKAHEDGDESKVDKAKKLHDGILSVWKQRTSGKLFRQKLWFDAESKRFRITPELETTTKLTRPTTGSDDNPDLF
jgi:KaiC/GvpD/RAD55 family RecA-like ATPase